MSMKDYTKFSNHKVERKPVKIQNGVTKVEEVAEPVVEQPAPKPVVGVVTGCKRLNVREVPYLDGPVACVITESTEVTIDNAESTDDFYKVCTAAGVEGFCMKKFIEVE